MHKLNAYLLATLYVLFEKSPLDVKWTKTPVQFTVAKYSQLLSRDDIFYEMTLGKGLFMFCYLPSTLIYVEIYAGTLYIFRILTKHTTFAVKSKTFKSNDKIYLRFIRNTNKMIWLKKHNVVLLEAIKDIAYEYI